MHCAPLDDNVPRVLDEGFRAVLHDEDHFAADCSDNLDEWTNEVQSRKSLTQDVVIQGRRPMLPTSTSAWSYLETSTYHRSCSTGSEIGEHEVCTPFHHDTEAIGGLARCAVRAASGSSCRCS